MGEGKRRAAAAGGLLQQAQALHRANRLAEAKDLYRQVLERTPAVAPAWQGLGTIALEVGLAGAAAEALAKAVALAPGEADARLAYARALQDTGRAEAAVAELQAACDLRPGDAVAWESLGIALQSLGETEAARAAYARAIAIAPNAGTRIKHATVTSPIVASHEALQAERARLAAALDELLADASLAIDDPLRAALWSNFYLAFHGANDRDLQERYARLYLRACPSLAFVAPHCTRPRRPGRRLRVGLVSRFFHNHSIGRTSRGFFAQLPRAAFEVTAILVAPVVEDEFSRAIRAQAEASLVVPQDVAAAREQIAALELDVLFYQDIGMEPFTYFLAFSRLAPVQCVSFGHPDTTGIPAMDWFVSNDLYEGPQAQAHYSERLFLLRELPTLAYYYRPELPQPLKSRADFGLPADAPLYLCPQNLFKFHPDMDALLAGILRADPRGRLVVIEGKIGHWTELLRRRWRSACPDVLDRIAFLPRQDTRDYVNLIALADVMLDTVHFNGMNTSLEAFAVGTPVVTLPGEFQRGRHTQAMLRAMGLTELIAADAAQYVEIATRLGRDAQARGRLREAILARNAVLYENPAVVAEFGRFFQEACAAAGIAPK